MISLFVTLIILAQSNKISYSSYRGIVVSKLKFLHSVLSILLSCIVGIGGHITFLPFLISLCNISNKV